ncbi:MAG: hypothetical protein M3R23_08160, partial [Actinomycetota bacterium]|nr:hypothetical protein [Actinomycetota bacterium]
NTRYSPDNSVDNPAFAGEKKRMFLTGVQLLGNKNPQSADENGSNRNLWITRREMGSLRGFPKGKGDPKAAPAAVPMRQAEAKLRNAPVSPRRSARFVFRAFEYLLFAVKVRATLRAALWRLTKLLTDGGCDTHGRRYVRSIDTCDGRLAPLIEGNAGKTPPFRQPS